MKKLSKGQIYRFCMADIAKGLFNGLIGNYLIYFFQPTVKSGIPNLLPENKLPAPIRLCPPNFADLEITVSFPNRTVGFLRRSRLLFTKFRIALLPSASDSFSPFDVS